MPHQYQHIDDVDLNAEPDSTLPTLSSFVSAERFRFLLANAALNLLTAATIGIFPTGNIIAVNPWTRTAAQFTQICTFIGLFHFVLLVLHWSRVYNRPLFTKGVRGLIVLYFPRFWFICGLFSFSVTCCLCIYNWEDIHTETPTSIPIPHAAKVAELVMLGLGILSAVYSILNIKRFGEGGEIIIPVTA